MTTPAALRHFFVYSPLFGQREDNEHEKLLYFFPSDVDLNSMMDAVGLAEALRVYTSNFSPDKPIDVMRTQKTRQVFLNPEKNFWISMSLFLPYSKYNTVDKGDETNYHDDMVQDSVLHAVIDQLYKSYYFFHGSLQSGLEELGREGLMDTLRLFFNKYIPTFNFGSLSLANAIEGIQFLPLDKGAYLRVQSLVNAVETAFPAVKHTCFLYNRHLVWSGLEQPHMRTLYSHLCAHLLVDVPQLNMRPKNQVQRAQSASSPGSSRRHTSATSQSTARRVGSPLSLRRKSKKFGSLFGDSSTASTSTANTQPPSTDGYLLGPESLADDESAINAPLVHITVNGEESVAALCVFQWKLATCCFLVDPAVKMDMTFYRNLQKLVTPRLTSLDINISERHARRIEEEVSQDVEHQYVYFNHMNLAAKSNVLSMIPSRSPPPPKSKHLPALCEMHESLEGEQDAELMVKTEADTWLVGLKSDERELFVVLAQKRADLIQVDEEVRKMCSAKFSNIFFVD